MYGNVGKVCRDKAPQHGLSYLQTGPMLGGEPGGGVRVLLKKGDVVMACVLLVQLGSKAF